MCAFLSNVACTIGARVSIPPRVRDPSHIYIAGAQSAAALSRAYLFTPEKLLNFFSRG